MGKLSGNDKRFEWQTTQGNTSSLVVAIADEVGPHRTPWRAVRLLDAPTPFKAPMATLLEVAGAHGGIETLKASGHVVRALCCRSFPFKSEIRGPFVVMKFRGGHGVGFVYRRGRDECTRR